MRLYLGGGGSADDEALLWQEWVRPGIRCVYWPFALEPSAYDEGLRWYQRSLPDDVDVVLWRDLAEHAPGELDAADVLLVGGGNTYALLDHIRRTGWADPVAQWVRDGGAYFGSSAGAVITGADIDVARFADPNDVGLTDTTGLRLLPGLVLRPHYSPADLPELQERAGTTGLTVLGLPEDGGVAVVDGEIRNPGPGDVAVVTTDGAWILRAGGATPLDGPHG
ncbi:MAG: Type 1 glutamine amidotransferase-like domain-containing protein [Actinobacteria bacterium]|nr:Type 1 glutamine amidotransferase-like domain-containing protein [Actinomycetota bacterium]